MNKQELRSLLASLVPAAIDDGKLLHFQEFSKAPVPEKERAGYDLRPVRPRRMHLRTGRMGAGFEIETYKKHSDY